MMKRILSIIGFTAVAVVFALAQITVDGNPSEWTGTPPTDVNTWKYSAGTAGGLNEWIWKDAQGDERTDFASPDTRVDILEVRIASDANYLYFLIKMRDIDVTSGYEAPMVQISIDRDLTAGSGVEWLGGWSDTQVNTNARWEYLVTTRFGSGNTNLRVWNTSWSASYVGSAAISATNDVIEGAIPWSAIGGSPNNYTLRFTFSTYRANTSDDTRDIGGPGTSNALDVVTTAGPNTWDEVSDGVIDYYVDIQFLNDQTLPVQAVSLVAITGNSKVTLVWETGSEFNNAGFEIYRKAQDENDFKYIAGYQTNPELRGLGTSSHGKRYTYTDENVKGGATYVYKIYAVDFNGNRQEFGSITANVVAEIPNKYVLYQNYPNPFNPGTEIRFDLPKSGNVKLEIFNSLGEKVAVLYDGFMEAGYGKVVRWNANGYPSGVYYYRLTADGFVDVKKMVLMK